MVCNFAILRIDWNSNCPGQESFSIGMGTGRARSWKVRRIAGEDTGQVLPPVGATRERGHELRRPEADFLRDGIYELRVSRRGVHYRILYFFHGAVAAVVSHGLVKEQAVPPEEIDRAIERKKRFEANPSKHTYQEV